MTHNTCDHCQQPITGHSAAMSFNGTVTRDLCHACYKAFTAWCGEAPAARSVPVVPAVRVVHQPAVRPRRRAPKPKPQRKRR